MVLAFLSPVLWYRKISIQPWNPFWCAFLKSSTWVWQLLQSSPSIPQSFNHSKADSFLQHPLCLALDCLSTSPQSLPVWQKHQTLNVLLHTSLFNDKFRQGSCLHTIQRRTEIPDRFRNAISFSSQTNISSCTFFLFSSVFFSSLAKATYQTDICWTEVALIHKSCSPQTNQWPALLNHIPHVLDMQGKAQFSH